MKRALIIILSFIEKPKSSFAKNLMIGVCWLNVNKKKLALKCVLCYNSLAVGLYLSI